MGWEDFRCNAWRDAMLKEEARLAIFQERKGMLTAMVESMRVEAHYRREAAHRRAHTSPSPRRRRTDDNATPARRPNMVWRSLDPDDPWNARELADVE